MPEVEGLAPDPLDAVAYTNPLGYLPALGALIAKGADEYGLLRWTSSMETIALYAAARMFEAASSERRPLRRSSLRVPAEGARLVGGALGASGDVVNGGALVVLGDLDAATYRGARGSDLVVLGDVRVTHLLVSGGLAVRGDVTVEQLLLGEGHGTALYVGGKVDAAALVLEDKTLRARKASTRVKLDAWDATRKLARTLADARKVLVASVFDAEGAIDPGALERAVRK